MRRRSTYIDDIESQRGTRTMRDCHEYIIEQIKRVRVDAKRIHVFNQHDAYIVVVEYDDMNNRVVDVYQHNTPQYDDDENTIFVFINIDDRDDKIIFNDRDDIETKYSSTTIVI
jgi:hypothetical protein